MITFYPTISYGEIGKYTNSTRALIPASSCAAEVVRKYGIVKNRIPLPKLPECVVDRAADCGGFVATRKWGDYRYSPEQYVEWLNGWEPGWAAMWDYCCEDEITSGQKGIVRERQNKTTEMIEYFWQNYQKTKWVWVPTIQGWETEDYFYHVQELQVLIQEMQVFYGNDKGFRVGIGTLCRRASVTMIRKVVSLVASQLPGIPLHLWGVKLDFLKSPVELPQEVISLDSSAWNGLFGTRREEWKQSGMPQRKFVFDVALPRYEAKVEKALTSPKQLHLFGA